MGEKIWFLKRCSLFERLTRSEAERLERRAMIRTFKKGEMIYFPTEPSRTVLLLGRGRVKIKHVTPEGKESIVAFIDEGEIFGELALLDSAPRSEYAEAEADSQILAISRDDLLWLIEKRPDVALRITKLVGLRRRRIENRLRNIVFRSIRDRVIGVLLELLESHGQRVEGRWEIRLRLSHQDVASLIGATRETVTGILGQLQWERLIQTRRRRIIVLDPDRLAAQINEAVAPVLATPKRRMNER